MATVEQIAEQLDKLSLLEAAQLSKLLQEKWGVSAAAPMAVAAVPGAGGGGGPGGRARGEEGGEILTPARGGQEEDPGHQGGPRGGRARPEGGQGSGRRRSEGGEGEGHEG